MKRLLLGALAASLTAACLPAANPFDPSNPTAAFGRITGVVKVFKNIDACAESNIEDEGVQILFNNQVFGPNPDGTFAADLPPGNYNITVTGPGYSSDSFGVVELAPGQTIDLLDDVDVKKPFDRDCGCHDPAANALEQPFQPVFEGFDVATCQCNGSVQCSTRPDGTFGKVFHLIENEVPWPPYLEPSATVTNETYLLLKQVSDGGDPSGNFFAEYQFQINGSDTDAWLRPDLTEDGDEVFWGVSLLPNRLNNIAYRSSDAQHNKSLVNFVTVEHDDIPPAPPTLSLDAGNGFIDLSWEPADRSLPDDAAGVVRDVEMYLVHYGVEADNLQGAFADQGASPVVAFDNKLRLSGLANGQRIYVVVEAIDDANNVSSSVVEGEPVHSAVPDLVTPVMLTESTPLINPPIATVMDDRLAITLDVDGNIAFIDLATGDTVGQPFDAPGAVDIALFGHILVVAAGPAGLVTIDVTDPDNPGNPSALPLPPGALGEAVGVGVQLGQAFVTVRGPGGGVWRVDIADGDNPATLAFHEFDGGTLLSPENIHGTVRVNGRFLATQYFGPAAEGGSVLGQGLPNTGDHILIMSLDNGTEAGARPCRLFSPTVDAEFVEVFTGDGIETPDTAAAAPRKHFAYYGEYLFAPYDGAVVVYDLDAQNLEAACSAAGPPLQGRTETDSIGAVSLGLRTAFAVDVAGGTMTVASGSRFDPASGLALPDRIDVVSLESLAETPGAQNGVTTSLDVVGRVDGIASRGGMRLVGPNAWLFSDRVAQVELFTPRVLSRVAEVGENPTGANIGMGPYVVHQRALRGVGIWDVTRPEAPRIVNATNCVPSCFEEQDLAGDLFLEGGIMVAALTAGGANNDAVMFVDVGSDPQNPINLGAAPNPCTSGPVQGVAAHHRYLFVGCADEREVHLFDRARTQLGVPGPGEVPTAFEILDGQQLVGDIADLAVARAYSPDGWEFSLIVLYTNGEFETLRIPPTIGLSIDSSQFRIRVFDPASDDNAETGFSDAQRLTVDGTKLYVTGRRACTGDECDNGALVNAVHVVDLETGRLSSADDWVLGHDEPEVKIAATGEVIIASHTAAGNVYEAYRGVNTDPVAITDPNAFGLDALVHGGHLFTADMNVFQLE